MKLLLTTVLISTILLPGARMGASLLTRANDALPVAELSSVNDAPLSSPELAPANQTFTEAISETNNNLSNPQPVVQMQVYAYSNPAGCSNTFPENLSSEQKLANVQAAHGDEFDLAERLQTYIWNGELGIMLDVQNDPYVFEFIFNSFQHPLTYRGDKVATIFLVNGFVVWFREYGNNFRLLAIPLTEGVLESRWGLRPCVLAKKRTASR